MSTVAAATAVAAAVAAAVATVAAAVCTAVVSVTVVVAVAVVVAVLCKVDIAPSVTGISLEVLPLNQALNSLLDELRCRHKPTTQLTRHFCYQCIVIQALSRLQHTKA
jgi:hypothetical protein